VLGEVPGAQGGGGGQGARGLWGGVNRVLVGEPGDRGGAECSKYISVKNLRNQLNCF
jgi:hypothetical protein